jgi:hypothetical protein
MLVLAIACIATVFFARSASIAPAATKNNDPTRIVVYSFNIHQMGDDWRAWVKHIDDGDFPMPDILLLQDVEDGPDSTPTNPNGGACAKDSDNKVNEYPGVETLKRTLDTELEVTFRWQAGNSFRPKDCRNEVAVMWRGGRFGIATASGKKLVRYGLGHGGSSCSQPDAGSPWIQVKLLDKDASDKAVSAVSYKTSHKDSPPDCPYKNVEFHDGNLLEEGWSGDLVLMGTDANSRDYGNSGSDTYSCWYIKTVEENTESASGCKSEGLAEGYTDPIYTLCGMDWDDRDCFDQNWSHGNTNARIDFIFAKRPGTTPPEIIAGQTETVDKGPTGNGCTKTACFSDHRSLRTTIVY